MIASLARPLRAGERRSEPVGNVSDSLLKRVAAGDMSAMQECMDRYGGLVWSLARRLCGSPTDAEDAVQEVFVSLWKNAERYDEALGEEVTFVAMIARRRLIDERRKRERQNRLRGDLDAVAEPAAPRPRDEVALADDARLAAEALKELSPDQQKVLSLAVHHGLTQEQIARHTGLPVGTVKTHVRRGLIKVREKLKAAKAAEEIGSTG